MEREHPSYDTRTLWLEVSVTVLKLLIPKNQYQEEKKLETTKGPK
jgi:hypothetical protein